MEQSNDYISRKGSSCLTIAFTLSRVLQYSIAYHSIAQHNAAQLFADSCHCRARPSTENLLYFPSMLWLQWKYDEL